ncbi:MAG: hypothetical protein ACJ8G3_16765 [Burkholderiaceae bacterium]
MNFLLGLKSSIVAAMPRIAGVVSVSGGILVPRHYAGFWAFSEFFHGSDVAP